MPRFHYFKNKYEKKTHKTLHRIQVHGLRLHIEKKLLVRTLVIDAAIQDKRIPGGPCIAKNRWMLEEPRRL